MDFIKVDFKKLIEGEIEGVILTKREVHVCFLKAQLFLEHFAFSELIFATIRRS